MLDTIDCKHGIPFAGECLDCKIDWYRDCLRDAQRRIESCLDEIHKVENEKRFRAAARNEPQIIRFEP
jgi:hypothetical protein